MFAEVAVSVECMEMVVHQHKHWVAAVVMAALAVAAAAKAVRLGVGRNTKSK